jgi:type II secretory pathway pseudopilin PulG
MSKISEKGRSMVEMLGVLAIIGVLSVGGIYGYTVAMRSNRVNEIAHAVSMLNTMGQALNNGQGDGTLDYEEDFYELPDGVELLQYDDHDIIVRMKEQDDCLLLTNKMGGAVTIVQSCTAGQVTLKFKNSGSSDSASGGGSGNNGNYEVVTTEPSGACTAGANPRCYEGRTYACTNGSWAEGAEPCN